MDALDEFVFQVSFYYMTTIKKQHNLTFWPEVLQSANLLKREKKD